MTFFGKIDNLKYLLHNPNHSKLFQTINQMSNGENCLPSGNGLFIRRSSTAQYLSVTADNTGERISSSAPSSENVSPK